MGNIFTNGWPFNEQAVEVLKMTRNYNLVNQLLDLVVAYTLFSISFSGVQYLMIIW